METTKKTEQTRTLREIANEIAADWKKPHYSALPYLQAMRTLNSIEDNYFLDSGKSIVCNFLANAATWKGETARRIKKELKKLANIK